MTKLKAVVFVLQKTPAKKFVTPHRCCRKNKATLAFTHGTLLIISYASRSAGEFFVSLLETVMSLTINSD